MAANNQQVQVFVDVHVRPHCKEFVTLINAIAQDKAEIDDIYTALNVQTPTWTDSATNGPSHLLVPSDVLGYNGFISDVLTFIQGHGQWPVIKKCNPVP